MAEKKLRKYLIIGIGFVLVFACDSRVPGVGFNVSGKTWSPDSRQIIFSFNETDSTDCLYLLDIKTATQQQLTFPPDCGGGEYSPSLYDPVWSPDGKIIAMTGTGFVLTSDGSRQNSISSSNIFLMDISNKHLQQVTNTGKSRLPVWSPDGKTLAFISYDDHSWGIATIDIHGDNFQLLTDRAYKGLYWLTLTWSVNGTYLAFAEGDRKNSHIYSLDVDTKAAHQLTNDDTVATNPAWLYDDFIVFLSRPLTEIDTRNNYVYRMEKDGRGLQQISDEIGVVSLAASSDGKRIAYYNTLTKSLFLGSVDDIQSGRQYSNLRYASELAWSPDGEMLLLATGGGFTIIETQTGKIVYEFDTPPAEWENSNSQVDFDQDIGISSRSVLLICCLFCVVSIVLLGGLRWSISKIMKNRRK